MANNPFDRAVISVRERPVSSDINQAQSQLDRTLRFFLDQFLIPRAALADERPAAVPISGFFGDAFRVREESPVAMEVLLAAGLGMQSDPSDTPSAIGAIPSVDDLSRYKPLPLLSDVTITGIPVGDAVNDRIDIIEVAFNRRLTDPTSRDVLNPTTGAFDPTVVNKSLAWDLSISDVGIVAAPSNSVTAIGYKTGQPSGTPAIPSITPGYVKIAEVGVPATATTIISANIKDMRRLLAPGGMRTVAVFARTDIGGGSADLFGLVAPPGVQVAASIASGFRNIYLVAGDTSADFAVAVAGDGSNISTTTILPVTAAIRADLLNAADTDPVLDLADDTVLSSGQSVIRVTMIADATDRYQIWW